MVDPPAAGTGLGGGVLRPSAPAPRPAGRASVRRNVLIVRGAPGIRNRLSARRRGRTWRIADAAAPLRAGTGCRRLGPRKVACLAAGVRRIVMYGGAGADRLSVASRTRALLVGGPGADRLTGGPLSRFRGGPGVEHLVRRQFVRPRLAIALGSLPGRLPPSPCVAGQGVVWAQGVANLTPALLAHGSVRFWPLDGEKLPGAAAEGTFGRLFTSGPRFTRRTPRR